MKWVVVSALATVGFALAGTFAGLGLAAASFSDPAGDNNEAPDVTSVAVSESAAGRLTVTVTVRNYATLPPDSWINLWFDVDSDANTGEGGDETLARYVSDATLEVYRWDGAELQTASSTGMTATFANGVLTLETDRAAIGATGAFGILAVASREQQVAGEANIAADFAPDSGRSAYAGPAPATFTDPDGDQPAAPDLTAVRVTDGRDGMVSFAISTPNFAVLPPEMLVLLLVDADGKASTGLGGADVLVAYQDGEVELGRWSAAQQDFLATDRPSRIQARNADGVLTLLVHRSELGDPARFRFALGAGHITTEGIFDAFDSAPETLFWQYALANRPALRLLAGTAKAVPARPVAGKLVTVTVPVRRSDTGKRITSGSVSCTVKVDGRSVAATGRVSSAGARCSFRVPANASGKRVSGTVTVRSGGKAVSGRFSYLVR
jgi:hypothetical protein